jgi:ketosteroid isomerase-like protein
MKSQFRRQSMRNRKTFWLSIVTLAAIGLPANTTRAAQEDLAAVRQASADFYDALNALFTGDVKPMTKVWSHAADVTYMGPSGGFQVGWPPVLSIWQEQADLKLGGTIEPADMQITVGRDIAVTQNFEKGENTNAKNGSPQKVSIRATNVFRKENGKWKMIGHHTDLLPFLQESFPRP